MALDHPDAVERLAVLNIVPTVDQFERMAAEAALDYFPWYLLAQPPPFAERVIGASAEYVVGHLLESWAATPGAITPEAADRYARAFTAEAISGICAEFRAAFHLDRPMDAADRAAGTRIGCPVLVHWGAEEGSMSDGPLLVWRRWAGAVEGGPLRRGTSCPRRPRTPSPPRWSGSSPPTVDRAPGRPRAHGEVLNGTTVAARTNMASRAPRASSAVTARRRPRGSPGSARSPRSASRAAAGWARSWARTPSSRSRRDRLHAQCGAQNQTQGAAVVLGFPFPVPAASRITPAFPPA